MLVNFIYSTPTWLWGTIFILLLDGLACAGLVLFHRVLKVDLRRAHNELTGYSVAVISVTYAVLLAFIAIATWESFSNSEDIVDREADCVGSIYRDTQGLPGEMGQGIRADIRDYVNTVIHVEWPIQQVGKVPSQGWEPLRRVHSAIVTMQPRDAGEAVIQAELLRTLNSLYGARSSRLSAVQGHIPEVIWWVIFLGGAVTTGYTYLFGFDDLRMHLITTAAVSTSMALVVVLIVALDWPFRGAVSVSSDALLKAEQSWNELYFPGSVSQGGSADSAPNSSGHRQSHALDAAPHS
jgi:Protein of unknown function (DUF4239)